MVPAITADRSSSDTRTSKMMRAVQVAQHLDSMHVRSCSSFPVLIQFLTGSGVGLVALFVNWRLLNGARPARSSSW